MQLQPTTIIKGIHRGFLATQSLLANSILQNIGTATCHWTAADSTQITICLYGIVLSIFKPIAGRPAALTGLITVLQHQGKSQSCYHLGGLRHRLVPLRRCLGAARTYLVFLLPRDILGAQQKMSYHIRPIVVLASFVLGAYMGCKPNSTTQCPDANKQCPHGKTDASSATLDAAKQDRTGIDSAQNNPDAATVPVCGPTQLLCQGTCAPCPTPTGTARHQCDGEQCVAEVCDLDHVQCLAGCCRWSREQLTAAGFLIMLGTTPVIISEHGSGFTVSKKQGTQWVTTQVPGLLNDIMSMDVAKGPDDSLHIVSDLRGVEQYTTNVTGTWQTEMVVESAAIGAMSGPGIVVDTYNRPHLLYSHNNGDNTKTPVYIHKVGGSWVREEIGPANRHGETNLGDKLAIDSLDRVHVLVDGELKILEGGTWSTIDAPSGSLAIDPQDQPVVASYSTRLFSFYTLNGSTWQEETIDDLDNPGFNHGLVVDANSVPHVSYCRMCNNIESGVFYTLFEDIVYSYRTESGWHTINVETRGRTTYPQIAVDALNWPHFVYRYAERAQGEAFWIFATLIPAD